MKDALIWCVLLGVPIAVALSIAAQVREGRRRRAAFAQLAPRLGFEYEPKGGSLFRGALARFPLLAEGFPRKAENVLRGRVAGRDVIVFDHTAMIGGADVGRRARQTAAAFSEPGRDLPAFVLRPRTRLGKRASSARGTPLELHGAIEFDRHYLLYGPRRAREVEGLFEPYVREQLAALPGWCVEAEGEWLLFYRPEACVEPESIGDFLDECGRLLDAILRRSRS